MGRGWEYQYGLYPERDMIVFAGGGEETYVDRMAETSQQNEKYSKKCQQSKFLRKL